MSDCWNELKANIPHLTLHYQAWHCSCSLSISLRKMRRMMNWNLSLHSCHWSRPVSMETQMKSGRSSTRRRMSIHRSVLLARGVWGEMKLTEQRFRPWFCTVRAGDNLCEWGQHATTVLQLPSRFGCSKGVGALGGGTIQYDSELALKVCVNMQFAHVESLG